MAQYHSAVLILNPHDRTDFDRIQLVRNAQPFVFNGQRWQATRVAKTRDDRLRFTCVPANPTLAEIQAIS